MNAIEKYPIEYLSFFKLVETSHKRRKNRRKNKKEITGVDVALMVADLISSA
jgi:hypothetical protein